jgi:hypothetical protein
MPNTNIQSLNYGDNQNQLINKLNNNFDEVVEFHGGSQGLTGPTGSRGPIGESGNIGVTGLSGPRGTRWFINATVSPSGSGNYVVEGDYWIESVTGQIYIFTDAGWTYTGYNFNATGSLFSAITSSYGPGMNPSSGLTGSSIVENQVSPEKYTFVISDNAPESDILNELLSKFLISTNPNSNSAPVLEFSKSNVEDGIISDYLQHPIFKWANFTSGDDSIILNVPGGIFTVGASAGFQSSSSDYHINASTSLSIEYGATSGSGVFSTGGFQLNAPAGNFNLTSYFYSVTGGSGTFSKPIESTSTLPGSVSSLYVSIGGTSGFRSTRSGDTSATLSHGVYHVKLENTDGTQFYLDTKGKLKTNKIDEGLTIPVNTPGITGSNNWFILSAPYTPDSAYTSLENGNSIIFAPNINSTSSYVGVAFNTLLDYSLGSTGGVLPGESIDINVYCGSDQYVGYWQNQVDGANYTGFKYIGYGTTAGVTTAVTLPFKAQAIDFTVAKGVTGPLTTVFYKAYSTGVGGFGASGGYFSF